MNTNQLGGATKKRQMRKAGKALKNTAVEAEMLGTLKPEKYTYGACGQNKGFCDANRYCHKDNKCIEKSAADLNHDNAKYRFCNNNLDKNCIFKAVCMGFNTDDINCRVVYK